MTLLFLAVLARAAPPVPAVLSPLPELPAEAGAWPCPVARCDWRPESPGLSLAPDRHIRVTAAAPLVVTVRPGVRTVGLVLMPVAGEVTGVFGRVTWGGLPGAYGTDLVAGRQVWAPRASGGWDNVAGVPLGAGVTADASGALSESGVALSASVVGISVPPGASAFTVSVAGSRALAVLAVEQWEGSPPFAFTPETYPAGPDWRSFDLHQDGKLALPRPAALGPLLPVTSPLRIDGERIVDGSGTPVRLYGTNVFLGWNLPSPEDSPKFAAGMAALGVNHVRFNIFPTSRGELYRTGAFRTPTVAEWERFDALVDALAANGIRMSLPLTESEAQWGKQTESALVDRAHTADLEPIYDPVARARQKDQIRAILGHVHPRRGVPLARDPVLGIVEISNEAGLVWEWPSAIEVSFTPRQREGLRTAWNAWLRTRYADDAALATAWADPSASNVIAPGESLGAGTVGLGPNAPWRWGTWSRQRRADLMAFLDAADVDYWSDMRRFLVEELGTTAIVIGTQHLGTVASNRQQVVTGIVDTHYQYDHPGDVPMEQARASLLRLPVERRLRTVPNASVPGQPFTVGEYNHGWPSPYEYEMPLLWATLGGRQGWDGMLWFTWRHQPWAPRNPGRIEGQMDVYGNPVKMGQFPAAAAIVRGGLVPEARGLAVTHLPDSAADSPRFPQQLPSPGVGDGQFLLDYRLRTSYAPEVPGYAPASAVGPARWNDDESLVLDVPGANVVVSSGAEHATTHLIAGGGPGAVSLVGLDAVPLAEARRWLLTVATRALNTGHRELGANTIASLGEGPILLAPYGGRVGVRGGPGQRPYVVRLSPAGTPEGEVSVRRARGTWWLDLAAVPPGTWFTVEWR